MERRDTHSTLRIPGGPDFARSLLARLAIRWSGTEGPLGLARAYVLLPFVAAAWFVGISALAAALPGIGAPVAVWTAACLALVVPGWRRPQAVRISPHSIHLPGADVSRKQLVAVEPLAGQSWPAEPGRTRVVGSARASGAVALQTDEERWVLGLSAADQRRMLNWAETPGAKRVA